ncbi:hypothetical protein HO133_003762 [Letharia lupina]|uniref:Uncharacterized protein n=1 Tax=Letharia lupina TaxID=560253 RepID=A0A8H6F969_9LECA|nr:uncharacterized protein HO133_003762 [Letharia lupina]KAF6219937.1 hypothetical protein HO133_003762 [Letharia lupina]
MPIRWTPETDQILLLKILETSDVSPKCAEIAERWPAGLDRLTSRAISERIFKIRAKAKASGTAGHFAVPSANSNAGTPRKKATNGIAKKAPAKKTNGTKGGAGKRKRGGRMSDDEVMDDTEPDGFKSDNNGSEATDDEVPKRKTKINSTAKGKGKDGDPVKVKGEEEENGTFHDSVYEDPFDEYDAVESVAYA